MSIQIVSKDVFDQNILTLQKFKIGQNVLIKPIKTGSDTSCQLSLIKGFSHNCFGELLLDLTVLSIFSQSALTIPGIQQIHPFNKQCTVEIL